MSDGQTSDVRQTVFPKVRGRLYIMKGAIMIKPYNRPAGEEKQANRPCGRGNAPLLPPSAASPPEGEILAALCFEVLMRPKAEQRANFPLRGKSRAAGIGVHFHAPQARLYGLRCLRQRCRRRRLSPPERSERNPFTQPAAQPRPFPPSEPRAAEGPLHFHFKKNKMVGMKILQ